MAQTPTQSIHSGHRDRVKEKFLENGLDVFADHEVLELLLFYSIARQDTNPLGHELLNKYHSLSKVFDADYDELVSIHGISHHTATLIKLIPQLCRRYTEDKQVSKSPVLSSRSAACEFIKALFIGKIEEELYIVCMDKTCKVLTYKRISQGTLDAAYLDLRLIADTVLKSKASRIILAHNHPSGFHMASSADIEATKRVKSLMDSMNVLLDDHYIVTNTGVTGMQSMGLI